MLVRGFPRIMVPLTSYCVLSMDDIVKLVPITEKALLGTLVTLGFMWAKMAVAAQEGLDAGTGDADFLKTKLVTGRYYMKRQLPMTATHLARIQSGSETVMELDQNAF